MDREALLAHYRRMPKETFAHFATHEAGDLSPEAVEILRQVMKERGIVPDPDRVIEVQRRRLSSEEFEVMVTRFRRLPCPVCGKSGELLNGIKLNRAGRVEVVVGCRSCLKQQLSDAKRASLGLALFHPLSGLRDGGENERAGNDLDSDEQTQALREYLWYNRGEWAHLLEK